MGSRLRGRIDAGAMPFLHRYLGTPIIMWVLNLLFGTRISDCNCGMRCIERQTFNRIGVVSSGMEFASEMIVKAAAQRRDQRNPHPFHKDQAVTAAPTCVRFMMAGGICACCCGTRPITP